MRVQMHVFSDRRNPSWRLGLQEAEGFLKILRTLLPLHVTPEFPQTLGYCGMAVIDESGLEPWREAEVLVYHDRIALKTSWGTIYFTDARREAEDFLLRTAVGHVEDAVIESIREEL